MSFESPKNWSIPEVWMVGKIDTLFFLCQNIPHSNTIIISILNIIHDMEQQSILTHERYQEYLSIVNNSHKEEDNLYTCLCFLALLLQDGHLNTYTETQEQVILFLHLEKGKLHDVKQRYIEYIMWDVSFTQQISDTVNTLISHTIETSHEFDKFLKLVNHLIHKIHSEETYSQQDLFRGEEYVASIVQRFAKLEFISHWDAREILEQGYEISIFRFLEVLVRQEHFIQNNLHAEIWDLHNKLRQAINIQKNTAWEDHDKEENQEINNTCMLDMYKYTEAFIKFLHQDEKTQEDYHIMKEYIYELFTLVLSITPDTNTVFQYKYIENLNAEIQDKWVEEVIYGMISHITYNLLGNNIPLLKQCYDTLQKYYTEKNMVDELACLNKFAQQYNIWD